MSAGGYPAMHEVILACVDGSSGGYAAIAEAAELAKRFGSRLIVLSVEEGLPRLRRDHRRGRRVQAREG